LARKRLQHRADLKAWVGLAVLKGVEPMHAIASRHEVHPVQVASGKGGGGAAAGGVRPEGEPRRGERERELVRGIGRVKMEQEGL
jgi:hypothetical protein